MNTHSLSRGFTLIELLVVVSIIAILSSASLTLYLDSWEQARDAVRLQDMKTLEQAFLAFYIENRRFPDEDNDGVPVEGQIIGVGNEIDTALTPYLSEIPIDPAHDAGTGERPLAGAVFFYSYDPAHMVNPDCDLEYADSAEFYAYPESFYAPVYGFNRSESGMERDIATCHGGNLQLNDADFNRVLQ